MKRYLDSSELECAYLFKDVEKLNGSADDMLNYIKLPITVYSFNDDNCEKFNHIASCLNGSHLRKIERTPSGGISKSCKFYPCYDIRYSGGTIEITIINYRGSFRLQWRNTSDTMINGSKMTISGHQAFWAFYAECKKHGILLSKYAHNDKKQAYAEKMQIEKPMIWLYNEAYAGKTFRNVHHIDFHSSYMSGLVNTHPEFKEVVEHIYSKRKEEDLKYKAILNLTQGYMQSPMVNFRYAYLSRDMIKDNNDRIREMTKILLSTGRKPILFNTDGIWYQGQPLEGYGEGEGIGKWQHDHLFCKFRAKSSGAYEYMEEGVYYPVVRGRTHLDLIKPRTEWQWGDIFRIEATEIKYTLENGYISWDGCCKGVREYEEEEI